MNINEKQVFWRLTGSLELFGYLLPVPYVLYYVCLASNLNLYEMLIFLGNASFFSLLAFIAAVVVRRWKLLPLLKNFNKLEELETKQISKLHFNFLNYPKIESLMAMIRWVLGVAGTFFFSSQIIDLSGYRAYPFLLSLIAVIPITSVCYYFITEDRIKFLLCLDELTFHASEFPIGLSTFARIFLVTMSVSIMPLVLLSTFLYLYSADLLKLNYPIIHISMIGLLSLMCIVIGSYYFAKSVRYNLSSLDKFAKLIHEGDLTARVPIISTDELAIINRLVNNFNNKLQSVLKSVQTDISKIRKTAEDFKIGSNNLSRVILQQKSSMEEIGVNSEESHAQTESISSNAKDQSLINVQAEESFKNLVEKIKKIYQEAESSEQKSEYLVKIGESANKELVSARDRMGGIEEASSRMKEAVNFVEEIADKVNLLSLNASIEAARAGEYGRGFAVVAKEISKLADDTQKNLKIINANILTTLRMVSVGSESLSELEKNFKEFINEVHLQANVSKSMSNGAKTTSQIANELYEVMTVLARKSKDIYIATNEQKLAFKDFALASDKVLNASMEANVFSEKVSSESDQLVDAMLKLENDIKFFKI